MTTYVNDDQNILRLGRPRSMLLDLWYMMYQTQQEKKKRLQYRSSYRQFMKNYCLDKMKKGTDDTLLWWDALACWWAGLLWKSNSQYQKKWIQSLKSNTVSTSTKTKTKDQTDLDRLFDFLKKKNIELICLDFDQTLIPGHTRGYKFNPLTTKIRPFFVNFIKKALKKKYKFSITTFSQQKDLIQKLWNRYFIEYTIPVYSQRIQGKNSSIKLAMSTHDIKTGDYKKVVLIDDDQNNIQHFKEIGGYTLHLVPSTVSPDEFELFGFELDNNNDDDKNKILTTTV